MPLVFTLNGDEVRLDDIPDGMLLIDVLRVHLGLTGTKRGCETGTCGMCSVLVDDVLIRSCRTKAADVAGRHLTTIEGIHGPDGALSDLQTAFLEHGAVQCGYCTPAMVLAAEALLRRHSDPTREQIRSAINGILCRCTGYMQIVDAIEATAAARTGQNRTAGRPPDGEQGGAGGSPAVRGTKATAVVRTGQNRAAGRRSGGE